MWFINRYLTSGFDAVFAFMEGWPGWLSLTVLSAFTGVVALVIYKYTSNQTAISRVHDDIRSSLLAAKLYKDDLGVTLRSQGRLFGAAGRLLLHSLFPLLVMIVPITLLLGQMAPRYEWNPLSVGEEVLLYAELRPGTLDTDPEIGLDVPPGVVVDVGATRHDLNRYKDYPAVDKLCWRLKVTEPVRAPLVVQVGDASAEKMITVSDQRYVKACPVRPGPSILDQLYYAVEPPAGSEDVIQRIELHSVPAGSTPFFGWDVHWAVSWLILSMVFALLAKPIIKVQMW